MKEVYTARSFSCWKSGETQKNLLTSVSHMPTILLVYVSQIHISDAGNCQKDHVWATYSSNTVRMLVISAHKNSYEQSN